MNAIRAAVAACAGVLAGTLTLTLALGGCVSTETAGREPVIETAIVNETDVTIRASLHAGERVRLRNAPITPIKDGRAREIIPGDTQTISMSRPRHWGIGLPEPNEDLVFWIRFEVITPTWGNDRVRWYEMLGPPARKITISASEQTDGTDLDAVALAVPMEEVDVSMHPFRDRNRAFGTEIGSAEPGLGG